MKILLVNDDGIHAPGLRALHDSLKQLGEVVVVAPLVEQSGVGHRITYLHPIMVKEVYEEGEFFGWAVDGSPADCVKLGVLEFCQGEPDLIVSGINSGANVGINVLYSGTVAAAIEGAFFGITSIAISLSLLTPADYPATAARSLNLVQQLLDLKPKKGSLWNINFPRTTPEGPEGVKWTAMAAMRHTDSIEKRTDPRGRPYYWSGLEPLQLQTMQAGTDVAELANNFVSVTPLHFDLTEASVLNDFRQHDFKL